MYHARARKVKKSRKDFFLKIVEKSLKKSKKQLTIGKGNGNIYKLSARKCKKNRLKKIFKKVKKSLKKHLTKGKGLWYYIQAVAAKGTDRTVVRVKKIKNGIRKK